jgi:hypothetical protein
VHRQLKTIKGAQTNNREPPYPPGLLRARVLAKHTHTHTHTVAHTHTGLLITLRASRAARVPGCTRPRGPARMQGKCARPRGRHSDSAQCVGSAPWARMLGHVGQPSGACNPYAVHGACSLAEHRPAKGLQLSSLSKSKCVSHVSAAIVDGMTRCRAVSTQASTVDARKRQIRLSTEAMTVAAGSKEALTERGHSSGQSQCRGTAHGGEDEWSAGQDAA